METGARASYLDKALVVSIDTWIGYGQTSSRRLKRHNVIRPSPEKRAGRRHSRLRKDMLHCVQQRINCVQHDQERPHMDTLQYVKHKPIRSNQIIWLN